MALRFDSRQIIHALSHTLDLVGIDVVQHGKRVALMACNCARAMNFPEDQLDLLYHASLLHDCGVSSSKVHEKLVSELDWSGSQDHCLRGERLLKDCQIFQDLAQIVKYHHTHWRDLPSKLDRNTALLGNLIYLVDRVDALMAQYKDTDILIARYWIFDTVKKYKGNYFQEELVDVFLQEAESEMFWLALSPGHLERYIYEMEQKTSRTFVDSQTILQVAGIFADIVDAKSSYTWEHSLGVSRLARFIGRLLDFSNRKLDMLEVAGLLHDLGKLNVPDEILEKPAPLTDRERAIMLRHSFESYQILNRIQGFEAIAQWVAFHHEDLSQTGYPFRKKPKSLSTECRIIALADVFQALAQKRPYRDSLAPEKIMQIMSDMALQGKLDTNILGLIESHLEKCWNLANCIE